ncbi:sodium-dependent transporter [Candidatus Parcubacteria bacterium]|nr:MAG: sodium-dependent transporter [Candidatus Parcubacteria bacterium]
MTNTSRTHWPSGWIFILAAIGSAAGLGNLWRFPFLAYKHGGAAFILVLILANIIVGIPLLILEVGLGQMTQRAAPEAFGRIKKGLRFVGWLALVFSFFVISYYMAVMAWGVDYLAAAFQLGWGENAKDFFFQKVLQLSDSVGNIGGFSWPVVAGFVVAWLAVYFSVWKGVKSVSKVVTWSATLPFIILAILIVRAITLPGSFAGLRAFFVPDWSALGDPQLWIAAFSQVFFSLSLAFGIMIAYGSFKPERSEITKSAFWVALGNFLVSLMSGIVVFGTIGYMAYQQGVPLEKAVDGGPSLAFVVFPTAISLLPALNALIGVLFFVMLLSLAIDSAFSIVEGIAAPFRDRYPHLATEKIALYVSAAAAVAGLPFVTKAGLYFLDIVDHFVVNYGIVVMGILEAFVVGWLWKEKRFHQYVNEHSKWKIGIGWDIAIKFITPVFLAILLIWNLVQEFQEPYGGYPVKALIVVGAVPLIAAPIIALIVDRLVGHSDAHHEHSGA